MIPKAVYSGADLTKAALARLPDLVDPALAGVARTLQRGLQQSGVTLETSAGPDGVMLTDASPGAFAREFGTLDTPANPLFQDAVAQASAGLFLSDQGDGGDV